MCALILPAQDVPEQRSMEYPKLYEPGQLNLLFNKREFFICIAQGIYTSVLLFFVPYGVFAEATRDDGTQLADYQSFAVTVATSLVIVVSVQVGTPSPLEGGPPVLGPTWAPPFCFWEGGGFRGAAPSALTVLLVADRAGYRLLDGHQPLLHLGQRGCVLCHSLRHAQQRALRHVSQPVPVCG